MPSVMRTIAFVLSDVCMPQLDGFELARMIRNHPHFQLAAIIFVSAVALTEPDRVNRPLDSNQD